MLQFTHYRPVRRSTLAIQTDHKTGMVDLLQSECLRRLVDVQIGAQNTAT